MELRTSDFQLGACAGTRGSAAARRVVADGVQALSQPGQSDGSVRGALKLQTLDGQKVVFPSILL